MRHITKKRCLLCTIHFRKTITIIDQIAPIHQLSRSKLHYMNKLTNKQNLNIQDFGNLEYQCLLIYYRGYRHIV